MTSYGDVSKTEQRRIAEETERELWEAREPVPVGGDWWQRFCDWLEALLTGAIIRGIANHPGVLGDMAEYRRSAQKALEIEAEERRKYPNRYRKIDLIMARDKAFPGWHLRMEGYSEAWIRKQGYNPYDMEDSERLG